MSTQIIKMYEMSNKRMEAMMDQITNGKANATLNLPLILLAIREFEAQGKLFNYVVQAFAVSSKNKRTIKSLGKMNLMETTTALDFGSSELDKVKCLNKDELITRAECLSYSGKSEHMEYCQRDCVNFGETRRILLPAKGDQP